MFNLTEQNYINHALQNYMPTFQIRHTSSQLPFINTSWSHAFFVQDPSPLPHFENMLQYDKSTQQLLTWLVTSYVNDNHFNGVPPSTSYTITLSQRYCKSRSEYSVRLLIRIGIYVRPLLAARVPLECLFIILFGTLIQNGPSSFILRHVRIF